MPISRKDAERMSRANEKDLILQSFSPDITRLEKKDVARRIPRARRLRDKYRTQAEARARAINGRAGTLAYRGRADVQALERKTRLLAEVLARYTKRLEKLETTPPAKFLKKALKRKKAAATNAEHTQTAHDGNKARAPAAPSKVHEQAYMEAGTKRLQGHISSQDKRNQAKRDNR